MARLLFTALVLAMVGCAGAEPTAEQAAREAATQETIQDILSTPLAAEDYGEQERCLSSFRYDHIDVLDDQHVVFRGTGDDLWLNKLRRRCPGLRRDDILRFDMRGNRLCALDNFDAVSSFMWSIKSSHCSLGEFIRVSPEQLQAIELAVKEAGEG